MTCSFNIIECDINSIECDMKILCALSECQDMKTIYNLGEEAGNNKPKTRSDKDTFKIGL